MPFITISRMYGSGGSEVAEIVARSLGWTLYDNAIIDEIARRSGLSAAQVSAQEERIPSLVERISGAFTMGTPEAMPALAEGQSPLPEEAIVATTRRVIEDAVQQGPAVLVGRGAQCLLSDRDDALHVFCYAPQAALIKYAHEHLGIAMRDADKRVTEMNRQREQYVRRHWSRNWLSPLNYHLCLDTSWVGVERTAALIVSASAERFP